MARRTPKGSDLGFAINKNSATLVVKAMFSHAGTRLFGGATIIAVALAIHPTWFLATGGGFPQLRLCEGDTNEWKIATINMSKLAIRLSLWLHLT